MKKILLLVPILLVGCGGREPFPEDHPLAHIQWQVIKCEDEGMGAMVDPLSDRVTCIEK